MREIRNTQTKTDRQDRKQPLQQIPNKQTNKLTKK